MAQAKRKKDWSPALQPATIGEHAGAASAPSPARVLQQMLEDHAGLQASEVRWSRRRSLAFIVASSAALWLALLAAVHAAMVAVA